MNYLQVVQAEHLEHVALVVDLEPVLLVVDHLHHTDLCLAAAVGLLVAEHLHHAEHCPVAAVGLLVEVLHGQQLLEQSEKDH